jgi:hypothetical protein
MADPLYYINEKEKNSVPSGLFTGQCGVYPKSVMYDSRIGPDTCLEKCKITNINQDLGIKKTMCFDERGCGYTRKMDGRLKDSARNQLLELNSPPYEGDIGHLRNVYSDKLKNYHTGYYKSYRDINSGQIQYYSNSELSGAFPRRTGNYVVRAQEDYTIYKDPMDGVELRTNRFPLTEKRPAYLCGPNFIKDSINHREDLMAKQSYFFNKNSFEARYGNSFKPE